MVERQLLASPYRSPAQARHKIIDRQGIYSPIRTPSPNLQKLPDPGRRPSTPVRPPLYRSDPLIDTWFFPDTPQRTPPHSHSRAYGPYLSPDSPNPPRTPIRTPAPLLFSAPATPAPTPGPIGSRKDRRTTVRVAHVMACSCDHFKHQVVTREPQISGLHPGQPLLQWAKRPIQKHVSIGWTKVQLNEAKGTAISYTWGDFDRENMVIGHWHDDPTRAISMNLGTEWDVSELLDRLVELTNARGSIWLDQLCVPQREDYICEILPKIPDIFRSMEVAVLMPGARCRCLDKTIKEAQGGTKPSLDLVEDWLNEKCLNKAGLSSYTNRMWARQEFRYAQNLRVVWNTQRPATCFEYNDLISGKADIAAITGYATALFMQKLHEGFDLGDQNGDWLIRDATDKFARDMRRECDGLKENRKELPTFFRMLLGLPLQRVEDAEEEPMYELTHSLKTFCRNLRGLAYGTHLASNPRDLVLSVWVDLPGYKMPPEMKFYSASELLDDAARKMEAIHHVTLSTHAPAGLFSESPGGCWRPEIFLGKKNIRQVRDLYSTLSEADSPIYTRDGKVPLQILGGNAIGRRSFVYRDLFNKSSLSKIGPVLSNVVKNLDETAQTRLGALWHDYQDRMERVLAPRKMGKGAAHEEPEDLVSFMAEYNFFDNLCSQTLSDDLQLPWDELEDTDHHKVVYQMTCHLLGLDADYCRRRGLELIIAPDEPAVIGLTNRITVPSWLAKFDQDSLTISTSPSRTRPQQLSMCMIEATKCGTSSNGTPEYRVIGSWVACQAIGKKDLGAIAIPRDVHSVQMEVMRTDGWLV
ncbi:hypothetical protein DRE_01137 [Drechslerella stenobrocha 248]|uniref:Heterokaryon incompatibility domain-containing protein n=1 Tax=Drechslerella stenobrocha 248 TaxID=1043628 RepID=W7HJZ7_9PEZI|nr:hypothetical protein DRE_01137 [Drechslerella stenobrocha 248]